MMVSRVVLPEPDGPMISVKLTGTHLQIDAVQNLDAVRR